MLIEYFVKKVFILFSEIKKNSWKNCCSK